MIQKDRSTEEKIFRGAYTYTRKGVLFTDESFEVYRDRDLKEQTFSFESELMSRVQTGEILKTEIVYKITKDYIPKSVIVKRSLGDKTAKEVFRFSSLKNSIHYTFFGGGGEIDYNLSVPPKFHIMVPSACTSALFLRSKKFDPTGRNIYTIVTSSNMWDYEDDPSIKAIAVEKQGNTTKSLKLDKQEVQATHYKVWDYNADDSEGYPDEMVQMFVSKHLSIPYLLEDNNDTMMKIDYLNNLDQAN